MLSKPKIEESRIAFKESLIEVRRDTLRQEAGPSYPYYSLRTFPYAVIILAVTTEGKYLFNREYRHPTGEFLLSCPGGYMDEGEDPIAAAKRELEEETGYQAAAFHLMGSAYPYAGVSAQKTVYVKAEGAFQASEPTLDLCEVIQTILMSEQELENAIQEQIPLDGTLCTALYFNHLRK